MLPFLKLLILINTQKSFAIEDYKYSIVVENDLSDYFMTEKICDVILGGATPIYIGAKKINEFYSSFSTTAQKWVKDFKANNGYEETSTWLDKIQNLKVTIIGESIIDQYTYCEPLAKSSKDPILAFQLGRSNKFPGGVLAIANNCQGWASEVSVLSFTGIDAGDYSDVISMIDKKIKLKMIQTVDRPSILKHRFVDKNSETRVFEFYKFEGDDLPSKAAAEIELLINEACTNSDVLIAADYGHGLFTPQIVKNITKQQVFLAVNTQSNAGNRGFNTISK